MDPHNSSPCCSRLDCICPCLLPGSSITSSIQPSLISSFLCSHFTLLLHLLERWAPAMSGSNRCKTQKSFHGSSRERTALQGSNRQSQPREPNERQSEKMENGIRETRPYVSGSQKPSVLLISPRNSPVSALLTHNQLSLFAHGPSW